MSKALAAAAPVTAEHTLEIDVFNPPRKAVLDQAQGSSMRERLPGLPG